MDRDHRGIYGNIVNSFVWVVVYVCEDVPIAGGQK